MNSNITVNISGETIIITPQLVQRYDRRLPRYTSYPPATAWNAEMNADDYRNALCNMRSALLSLYIHFPFCPRRCTFCGCNAIATKNRAIIDRYVSALVDEMEMVSSVLSQVDVTTEVIRIHFGGGSPDYIPEGARRWMLDELSDHFWISDSAEISIEVDPMRLLPTDVMRLRAQGFNRISFGVQDFDEQVLASIGRHTDPKRVCELIDVAEEVGFRSTAVDLVYGLPFQSWENFERTVDEVASIKPDRIALFNFANLPESMPHQKQIPNDALPSPIQKIEMLAKSIGILTRGGYIFIGLDHFVRRDDSIEQALRSRTLNRSFQGYEAGSKSNLIGLGCTSISKIGDQYFQNQRKLKRYMDKVEAGEFSVGRGYGMTDEDRMRGWIINELMCYREVWNDELKRRWGLSMTEACGERMSQAEQK